MLKIFRWSWVLAALLLCIGGFGVAGADPGVNKLRETGMAAYQSGDYAAAKRAFDEAYRLSPLHSLGLWAARARVKLNEWVEADERLEVLVATPISGGDASREKEALEQAMREHDELRRRMPRVRIRIDGADGEDVKVQINGESIPKDFFMVKKSGPFSKGKALRINPGTHQIVAITGEQRKEVSVSVTEGQTKDVSLRFVAAHTIRQRNCRDKCRKDCGENNDCYMECKERCFS